MLPGSLQAFEESPIYARTNGYLVRWYKDIGSRVKEGELLATIDTPEVDQELNQTPGRAAADRRAIGTGEDQRRPLGEPAQKRFGFRAGSRPADQRIQAGAGQSGGRGCKCRRLEQLEGFKKVYAPFSGVLTKRNVDPGALINAGAGRGWPGIIRYRARGSIARLHQRSAGICALHQSRRRRRR